MVKQGRGPTEAWSLQEFVLDMEMHILSELCDFFDSHYCEEAGKLERRWAALLPEGREWIIDGIFEEGDRLDRARQRFGHAMAILLCSLVEEAVLNILQRLDRDDPMLAEEYKTRFATLPALNFLEKYIRFHTEKLGDGLAETDVKLLQDFVWTRNRIVHGWGIVSSKQANDRSVPSAPFADSADKVTLDVYGEYLKKITRALRGFLNRVYEDLRVRYENKAIRPENSAENQWWTKLSEAGFAKDWDNERDAVYDNWRKLYGVAFPPKGTG